MKGDTIFSYHSYTQAQDGNGTPTFTDLPAENWIVFSPNFIGDWHWKSGESHGGETEDIPDVVDPDTWSWSPNETEDTWDYGKCEMPWATNFAYENGDPEGQDSPQTYNVSYSATDNIDGATATAKYAMTLHDPIEKKYTDHTTRIAKSV